MYQGVKRIFSTYWAAYGGWQALVRSPYLHAAAVLLLATLPVWSGSDWWSDALAVLPSLLGFTLGGFAIFIGFGDERFRSLLADPEEDGTRSSIYVALCATFVHFILVQSLALTVALLFKAWHFESSLMDWARPVLLGYLNGVGGAIGYFLFLYALTSVVAATMHVFRIATMYESYRKHLLMNGQADNAGRDHRC